MIRDNVKKCLKCLDVSRHLDASFSPHFRNSICLFFLVLFVHFLYPRCVLECQKGEVADQVHYPRDARPLGIHNFYNRLVVTEKQDALIGES